MSGRGRPRPAACRAAAARSPPGRAPREVAQQRQQARRVAAGERRAERAARRALLQQRVHDARLLRGQRRIERVPAGARRGKRRRGREARG
jgi:hypothetical protein